MLQRESRDGFAWQPRICARILDLNQRSGFAFSTVLLVE